MKNEKEKLTMIEAGKILYEGIVKLFCASIELSIVMKDKTKRPSKRDARKENKKYPYRPYRKK